MCVVRGSDVLQNAHTVIILILWEMCLYHGPVYKTRSTIRSIVMRLWSVLEVVRMGTAIRRPLVSKLFPLDVVLCRVCVWHVYQILSILNVYIFPHIFNISDSEHVSQPRTFYNCWRLGGLWLSLAADAKLGLVSSYWYHFNMVLDWSYEC